MKLTIVGISFLPLSSCPSTTIGRVQIKIGRQTNAKTAPGERNGYFDSKVLSRMHADVWEQDGKVGFLFL